MQKTKKLRNHVVTLVLYALLALMCFYATSRLTTHFLAHGTDRVSAIGDGIVTALLPDLTRDGACGCPACCRAT